jgi:hypothetical protein
MNFFCEVERMVMDEIKSDLKVVADAAEKAIAKILNPELRPEMRAAAAVRHLAKGKTFPIHPTRANEAAALIEEFERKAVELLRRPDYEGLGREINNLWDARVKLSTPVPQPTNRERWLPVLSRLGWGGEEMDNLLLGFIKDGVTMRKALYDRCELSDGRVITRLQIRLGLKPRWSSATDTEWLARFAPIRRVEMKDGILVDLGDER